MEVFFIRTTQLENNGLKQMRTVEQDLLYDKCPP